VDEIPCPERPLLAFGDQERFAREDEEVLLIVLVVVHGHRLPGTEDADVEAQLRPLDVSLEECELAQRAIVSPARILRVEDKPAFADGNTPGAGVLERGFGHHRP
jgi:hypothetical protein